MKSELTLFQSLSWLFQLTYFVKCKRTLLELNFYQPYPSSERERKFCHCLFTSFTKREIRHFHVVVVQWRQRNSITKKRDTRAKLLFCLVKLLLFLLSRRRFILNFLLFTIHCDPSETEFSQCKSASADSIWNVFRLIGSSFVSGYAAWWTNRATAVVNELTKRTHEMLFADWAQ